MTTSKLLSSRINMNCLSAAIGFFLLIAANISTTVEGRDDLTTLQAWDCGQSLFPDDPYFDVVNQLLPELASVTPNNQGEYTTSKTDHGFTVYGFADCEEGYTSDQCSECLGSCIDQIFILCGPAVGAEVELTACGMKYDDYQFYN